MPNSEQAPTIEISPLLRQVPKLTSENIEKVGSTVLYKGPPGTYKTTNILSWPGRKLLLYHDANTETAAPYVKRGEVELWQPESLDQLENQILPAIRHREFDVDVVGIDTLSSMASVYFHWLEGAKGANKYTWGRLKQVLDNVLWSLTSTTFDKKGKRSYNCICSSHVQDISEGIGDARKVVKANQPLIDGGFKDRVEGYFDVVLLTASEPIVEFIEGKATVTGQRPFCYSVPPTAKDTCKSQGLPPIVGGTYPELMEAWGRTVESAPATETTTTTGER